MSIEVTTAFVQQYSTNVGLLLQQRGSKLREAVTMGSYTGKAAKAVEQIGSVTAQKRTSRHADTPLISTPHDARWVFPTDYEWADMIDDQDKLRMLIDPTSPYALNGAYALGRAVDSDIISTALGTAKTGENGTTDTAFDTTNQQIASGSVGLTVGKLRETKKILLSNEVDVEMDPLYIAVTAKQIDDLLGTTEVTSADYNTVKALAQGQVDSFMGFKFIRIERLPFTTALTQFDAASGEVGVGADSIPVGSKRCFAYAGDAIIGGIGANPTARVSERPDKHYANQVYFSMSLGAMRMEEVKVIEFFTAQ